MSDEDRIDEDAVLRSLARKLRRRRPFFFAWKSYNLTWDAVYWCDELPWRMTLDEQMIMSAILHYRTTTNLERPHEDGLRTLWDAAQGVFPWWVGFWPSRNKPSRSFKLFYLRSRRYAWRQFKEFWDEDGTRHNSA